MMSSCARNKHRLNTWYAVAQLCHLKNSKTISRDYTKPTIDYRNTLIKARSMWLGLKKDGERLSCIKDCERYLVLIILANYMLL